VRGYSARPLAPVMRLEMSGSDVGDNSPDDCNSEDIGSLKISGYIAQPLLNRRKMIKVCAKLGINFGDIFPGLYDDYRCERKLLPAHYDGLFEEVLLRFVKRKIPHTEWPAGWQSKKTHGGGIIATRMIRKIDPLAVSKEILEIETHQLVTFRFDNKMNTLGVAVQDRHMNDTCEATCVLMREILDIGARAQQTYKGKSK